MDTEANCDRVTRSLISEHPSNTRCFVAQVGSVPGITHYIWQALQIVRPSSSLRQSDVLSGPSNQWLAAITFRVGRTCIAINTPLVSCKRDVSIDSRLRLSGTYRCGVSDAGAAHLHHQYRPFQHLDFRFLSPMQISIHVSAY